jgi:hypothetical protein
MRMLAQMQLQQQQQRRRNHHVLFVHPSLLVSPQPSQLSSTTAAAGAQQVAEATAGMSSATTPAYTTSEAAVPSAHVPPASPSQTGSQGPGSSISTLHPALQQVEGRAGEQPQDEQQHQGQVQVQQPGAAALGLVGRMMSLPVMKRQAWGLAAAQGQHRQQLSHRTAMPLNQQLLGLSAAAGTQPMQHAAPATRQLVLEQGNEAVFAPVALHGMAGLSLQDFDTLHVINQGYAADVHQVRSDAQMICRGLQNLLYPPAVPQAWELVHAYLCTFLHPTICAHHVLAGILTSSGEHGDPENVSWQTLCFCSAAPASNSSVC